MGLVKDPEVLEGRLEVWPVKPSVKEGVSPCSADGRPTEPQDSHRPNGHHQEPTWRRKPVVSGSFLTGMNVIGVGQWRSTPRLPLPVPALLWFAESCRNWGRGEPFPTR